MATSGVLLGLLVLVPSLVFLVAGIALLVYGVRRQRRAREQLQSYVGQRLQEEDARPADAPVLPPPPQDNTGLVWAIVGGVLTFFGVTGVGFMLVVAAVVALRSQTG